MVLQDFNKGKDMHKFELNDSDYTALLEALDYAKEAAEADMADFEDESLTTFEALTETIKKQGDTK